VKFHFIILLFFIVKPFLSFSQEEEVLFHGKVVSKNGFVYNANILNKRLKYGTTTDFSGDFSMTALKSDTIAFSCIGYKSFTYIIPDTIKSNEFRVLISMVADTVNVRETIITPWPINTTALKRAFLAEDKKEKEIITTYAGFRKIDKPQREPPPTLLNPISFIANIFSKKRIAKVKMDRIRRKLREGKTK